MLQLSSNYVKTAGYKTHYVESGAGQALILLHGGGAGADGLGNWGQCIPGFDTDFRTIAYDMVGFGKTDAPDVARFPYDKDARAEQAIAFIEALDLAPVNIIGNSMGGAVALGVAMRRPDLLNKIVLMSSAGLNRVVPPAITSMINYKPSLESMRAMVRGLTRPGFEIDEDLVRYRFALLDGKPDKLAAFVKTMTTLVEAGGLFYEAEEIAKIKTKALIFHGRDDRAIPLEEGFRMLQLLSEAHSYFVPHCGHWAMMEQTETFVRVSKDFLLSA